jgi:hypothetical protein
MADNTATILIPDISGFTQFMTTTELSHSSHAINILIDAMINAVGDEYEVSEIEGDAILLIRKGSAPTKKAILATCLRIFNGFHFQRKWLQQYAVCPCGACLAISELTLKFVVHHGPLAEIRVGRFVKQSGKEMIVAHRLLKNSIDNNEYLLVSEKLLRQMEDAADPVEMDWNSSSDEYGSIGKIEYHFASLQAARKLVPVPPAPQQYFQDATNYFELPVNAGYRDVYMTVMNIPERPTWFTSLQKVEQSTPLVYVGSIHHCTFADIATVVSPLHMKLTDAEIMYAESCSVEEPALSITHEFLFKKTGENTSTFSFRLMNDSSLPIPPPLYEQLFTKMKTMAASLKAYCEENMPVAKTAVNAGIL